jgi:hypothetical protein
MESLRVERRLAAIMAAEVVVYSRLMKADAGRQACPAQGAPSGPVRAAITAHISRILKRTGDGSFAEFTSAVGAVAAAVELHPRDQGETRLSGILETSGGEARGNRRGTECRTPAELAAEKRSHNRTVLKDLERGAWPIRIAEPKPNGLQRCGLILSPSGQCTPIAPGCAIRL